MIKDLIFNCEFSAGFFLVQGKENRGTPVGLASTLQDRRWVVCLFSILSYISQVVKRGRGECQNYTSAKFVTDGLG